MPALQRLSGFGIAAFALLTVAGCSRSAAPEYFPLGHGDRWTYAVTETNALGTVERPMTIEDAGPADFEGQRHWRRRTSEGSEYWLRAEGPDLLRVATRTAVEFVPRADPVSLKIMPIKPAVGDRWSIATVPYILERAIPFRERFTHDESLRIELQMHVASLDETVTVPAGTFEHCLRIDGEAVLNILADARIGASEVPVTQQEWYAPGIGLVKLVRTETLDTANIVGGSVTMELLEHRR